MEFWLYENGMSALAGVPDDPNNPPVLSDAMIIDMLTTIPEARSSFDRLVGTMLPKEQERLLPLRHQGMAVSPALDHLKVSDDFQKRLNTAGVRTCGPRGGGGWAPPPMREP